LGLGSDQTPAEAIAMGGKAFETLRQKGTQKNRRRRESRKQAGRSAFAERLAALSLTSEAEVLYRLLGAPRFRTCSEGGIIVRHEE
jgi:hypothetical protein